jgi:serine/threonine-protein kinase PRP4
VCAAQVIRSNETMSKAAALEQRILRMLSDKDPDNRKHVIRLLRTFEYRHHVCMVFEPMVSHAGSTIVLRHHA